MRFYEFAGDDIADRFVIVLKNYIGRAASKKAPSKLNWQGLNSVLKSSGSDITADYETFKSIYDVSPVVQQMVHDFNADGITLKVPGVSEKEPPQDGESSADKVDQMAAGAIDQQMDQYAKGAQA